MRDRHNARVSGVLSFDLLFRGICRGEGSFENGCLSERELKFHRGKRGRSYHSNWKLVRKVDELGSGGEQWAVARTSLPA